MNNNNSFEELCIIYSIPIAEFEEIDIKHFIYNYLDENGYIVKNDEEILDSYIIKNTIIRIEKEINRTQKSLYIEVSLLLCYKIKNINQFDL